MKTLRLTPVLVVLSLLVSAGQLSAQEQARAPQLPGCELNCYSVILPYGLYVREITEGGSFVTLEDGSIWEIRLPQRPVASGWQPGDFVQLQTVAAPVDRFNILLTHGDYDEAEARLAGRAPKLPIQE